jgi:hypothetical protein
MVHCKQLDFNWCNVAWPFLTTKFKWGGTNKQHLRFANMAWSIYGASFEFVRGAWVQCLECLKISLNFNYLGWMCCKFMNGKLEVSRDIYIQDMCIFESIKTSYTKCKKRTTFQAKVNPKWLGLCVVVIF